MIRLARVLASLLVVAFATAWVRPALAQFAAQQTYVSSSGGGANAFSVTVPNINQASDLVGVPIRVLMSASNSSAATLSVSNGASTVLSNVAIDKPTTAGLSALVGNEIRSGQISTFIYDGTVFEIQSPTLNLATTQSQSGFTVATNLQIDATVNSNQLTIALKAATTGSDPNVANPIFVPFRDTTIANGDPVWRGITSAVSFTIGSGNTMGCLSGFMCRLWVVAIDNGGTVDLCAFNTLSGTNIAPINEAVLQSTAISTNGGNSPQAYYCNASAITARAIRILGYIDVQESVAGTWAAGPTYVQLFGPGIKKPGDIVQAVSATGASSGSSAVITPSASADLVKVSFSAAFSQNTTNFFNMTRNATAIYNTGLTNANPGVSTYIGNVTVYDAPYSNSAVTYAATLDASGYSHALWTLEEIMR